MTRPMAIALSAGALSLLIVAGMILRFDQLASALTTSTYRSEVLADSPRAYWRLGETSGTFAADETPNRLSGTYQRGVVLGVGGAIVSETNSAARLDGLDDQVNMGNPASGALNFGLGDFTIEAWVRTTQNGDEIIASKQSSSGAYWQVAVTDDAGAVGTVRTKLFDGVVSRQAYGPALRVDDGIWHHVVVAVDRDVGVTIYVDKSNVRQTLGPATGKMTSSAKLLVGGQTLTSPALKGDLDEVAIYPALLPADRVQAHYDQAKADTVPPAVSLAAPAGGSYTNDSTPTFRGSAGVAAGDASTISVRVYGGTGLTGPLVETLTTARDGAAWTVDASPALVEGTYTAQAEQQDQALNTGRSVPATFTVDTTAPAPTLTAPAAGSQVASPTPTFTGTASTGSGDQRSVTLRVYAGSAAQGTPVQSLTATADPAGAWSAQSAALPDGTYSAQAEQLDQALNAGLSAPSTFTLLAPASPPALLYRTAVLADGPRAYWRLGETAGAVAADETGNGLSGSYQNGVALGVPGAIQNDADRAARLDGVDDRVNMGDPASGALDFGTADFSFEAWIRTTANRDQIVASKQGSGTPYWQVTVTDDYGAAGRIRARLYDGSVTRQAYGPAVHVDDGSWHHVAVAFDRDTGITIYVDKSYVRQTLGAMTGSVNNSASLLVGGETVSYYPPFKGDLDEVAVYPALVSAARVGAHYDQVMSGDGAAPAVSIGAPDQFAAVSDTTPTVSGLAGMSVGDAASITVKLYAGSLAGGTPVQTMSTVRGSTGAWGAEPGQPLQPGTYTAQAEQVDAAGNRGSSASVTFSIVAPAAPSPSDPVLLAAGDIADCASSGDEATAAILDGQAGTVATVGDNVYESGTDAEFANCYAPTWGRHKARTWPALGDHEYETPGAAGYFRYFGAAAGDPAKGYYSYDLGSWHVVVLNANCGQIGGCEAGSPQEAWLRADLSAHPAACTLSVFGSPLFSSGNRVGNNLEMKPLWQALYDYRADVALAGDDHDYERFAPQDPAGNLDLAAGIGEFVIGTGGRSHYSFPAGVPAANSQIRNDTTFGVLRLALHPGGYDWSFLPESGRTFTDAGSRSCR